MRAGEVAVGWLVAIAALYGLGIPLALLFPAPAHSPWIHRIAIAPAYSIAFAASGAWLLGLLGVPLDPSQLVAAALVAIVVAWVLHGRPAPSRIGMAIRLRSAAGAGVIPGMVVALAGASWLFSLVGYGVYLPNRDFKNHAFWVAMVATERSAEPGLVLRASPLSPPNDVGFYPLGLHTLLGWALPAPSANAVTVTAAAALLAAVISGPLALMVLARRWRPRSLGLPTLAGLVAATTAGLGFGFELGSATLVVGTAVYAAGLSSAWLWVDTPSLAGTLSLVAVVGGLSSLHVAEGFGLMLVASVAVLWKAVRGETTGVRGLVVLSVLLGLALFAGWSSVKKLAAIADFALGSFEDGDPFLGILNLFLFQPGSALLLGVVWATLVVVGVAWAARSGLSSFPLIALAVPALITVVAKAAWLPEGVRLIAGPWYGSVARISMLAAAPIILFGCQALCTAMEGARRRGSAFAVLVMTVALLVASTWNLIPERRHAMSATLAGAGDTFRVARDLANSLQPGERVLNLEDDGTSNLFAFARVPVTVGSTVPASVPGTDVPYSWLQENLTHLGDPSVARVMAAGGIAYLAVGTTSVYYGSSIGYALDDLLLQPQLTVWDVGTDMVILRYRATGS